jgi:ABC-type uncharacterized transport system involved in gliding motility auxiliary subunit
VSAKIRSGKYIKFLVYMIVVVLLNVAGITLALRIDLTEDKVFSISKVSKDVVRTLSEPLTINVFFTKNLPAPHNNTERYLHDLLEEYALSANKYFNYRFYDVSTEEGDIDKEARENQELARNYGIYPIQIQNVEEDEVKFKKAYMGLVLIHGDMVERIPAVTSMDGLEYNLTTAIQKLNNKISALLSLPDKIKVKLFLSSSLEIVAPYMHIKGLADVPDRLESIVKKMNPKTYWKLDFEYLDPSTDPTALEAGKRYSMMNVKWPALSDAKIQPGEGMIGLVMEYGDKVAEIPLVTVVKIPIIGTRYQMADMDKMEEILNENMESLIDINQDLGFLVDRGAMKIPEAYPGASRRDPQAPPVSNFRRLVSQNYSFKEVTISEGVIPQGLDCLVMVRPQESFSEYELYLIDQFLMQGKNLCLFLDRFKEEAPGGYNRPPQSIPLDTGLEKLLSHYGIHMKMSYVMDENCYKQEMPQGYGGGQRPIYFAPIIKSRFISKDLAFMKNIKGLIGMKLSPIEIDEERLTENDIIAHRLFSSSEKSWEMKERINLNPMYIRPPESKEDQKSLPLAYVLEGAFPSYFKGKEIPIKEETGDPSKEDEKKKEADKKGTPELAGIKGEGGFLSKGKPAKIFVMGSSEMLKDNMLDPAGRSPNATFILNVIDYLNNREDIAVMRGKTQSFNPLYEAGPGTKTFVKSLNIVGLPIFVAVFGFFILLRRHSRKRRIQMMFQK